MSQPRPLAKVLPSAQAQPEIADLDQAEAEIEDQDQVNEKTLYFFDTLWNNLTILKIVSLQWNLLNEAGPIKQQLALPVYAVCVEMYYIKMRWES